MSFGGIYGPADVAESHRTLARALELGIDHLDVADIYGNGISEEVIGSFVKRHPGRFTIATKAGIKSGPHGSFDNSPSYLRECLEGCLWRLGVDHIGLFYIHRREQAQPIEDVVETLLRFKDEGKIGGIGFSEISPASLERACAVHPIMAVQNEYSLWTRLPELGMVQTCKRLGVALAAFSPLGRGIFSECPPDPQTFAETDFRKTNPRFMEPNFSYNRKAVARFADFARRKGHSSAALALAWMLSRGEHIIAIPGTRSAEHLAEGAKGASIQLSAEALAEIDAILPVGFAHGDRYSDAQAVGPERYC
jgi:aryl-alcohol dehydrogenase-like predicted oxidoreductase